MNNNFLCLLCFLLSAGLIASCNKLIQIPANPPTAISQEQQFADSANTMTAVAGVYDYYAGQAGGFPYQDAYFTIYTGLSSDELSTTQNSVEQQQFYSYGLTKINTGVALLWSTVYASIYPVNAILEGIANNSNLRSGFAQQIKAEMLVVRSLYYFNLVNLFGAVPLVNSTDYRKNARLARASVDSIYNQIITDLTEAVHQLPAGYPSPGRARPNSYTALTLLAKVHLYRGDWQEAYDEADSVIRSGLYRLEPELNKVFLDGSTEAIWQLPASTGYSVTREASSFIPYSSGVAPNYLVTPLLLKAFEAGDQRRQDWVYPITADVGGNTQTFYIPYKYKQVQPATPVEDYMMLRLGEVYLIRAEATANLGKLDDALADVNIIRQRAGLSASKADPGSKEDVLHAIMHERQVELFTEWGSRWFDLKRTGRAVTVLGTEKSGWTDQAALYPIPQTQIQLNNLLTQNPGY